MPSMSFGSGLQILFPALQLLQVQGIKSLEKWNTPCCSPLPHSSIKGAVVTCSEGSSTQKNDVSHGSQPGIHVPLGVRRDLLGIHQLIYISFLTWGHGIGQGICKCRAGVKGWQAGQLPRASHSKVTCFSPGWQGLGFGGRVVWKG